MLRSLLCLLAAVALLRAGDAGDAPPIAVVRLVDAFKATKVYQNKLDAFKKEKALVDAKVKEFDERLQQLTTSIEALPAGNEKLAQLQDELDATKARREGFVRRISQDFERRNVQSIRECYKEIRGWLGEFCKSRGIKIVVQAADTDINGRDMVEINLRLEMQPALYWDPSQDITEAFIAFANAKWAEKAGGGQ
jgi:Skp family chaperone for outer membrane proteins